MSGIRKLFRLHHWTKNILIFVAPVLALEPLPLDLIFDLILSFFALSFAASAGYIVNDVLDKTRDLSHSVNRLRPIPQGEVSTKFAMYLALASFAMSVVFATLVSAEALLLTGAYLLLSILYSSLSKSVQIFDIFHLSVLYVFRLFFGSVISGVELSEIFTVFAFFAFFGLASVKRSASVQSQIAHPQLAPYNRTYEAKDVPVVNQMAIASATISTALLAVFFIDSSSINFFSFASLASYFFLCLFLWSRVSRGKLGSDPIRFVITSPATLAVMALMFTGYILSELMVA